MKKILCWFIFFTILFIGLPRLQASRALEELNIPLTPIPCRSGCPTDMSAIYQQLNDKYRELEAKGDPDFVGMVDEGCSGSLDEFLQSPTTRHFWVEDPQITAQGKTDERARQFIYWAVNKNAIDDHPILKSIWATTRNVAYFLLIFVVAIIGIGFIIGQRANFELKIKVWPSVIKIAVSLLYIALSASIVIVLIQLSEILMKFFIENLGGKDLFNIYFSGVSQETNYLGFIGCRDLNLRIQEGIKAEMFLLKLTNITYYVMGTMIILRKIILWFLLFVSPFLAVLIPFVFIRNIGWIWIGVFFQWLFYGPLWALFLGALATIWKGGIPFPFDFSRVDNISGYIFPTAINITYGGPAQNLGALNSGNYVDTFAEYVITLIMLWAVTFFPWWLLRIFRDYCCDGIYAMKNILMSMYDQMRSGPSPQPPPQPSSPPRTTGTAIKIPKEVEIPIKVKIETIEEVKKAKTEEITKSLNLSVSRLTDIARVESTRQTQETVRRHLDYLANPIKAETPTEKQKFMHIRNELFSRAIKEDHVAKQVLSALSTSRIDQMQMRQNMIKSIPQTVPVAQAVSVKVKIPQSKVTSVNSSFISSVSANTQFVNNLSQVSQVATSQVQTILNSFKQNINQTPSQVVNSVTKESGLEKEKIIKVIKNTVDLVKTNKEIVKEIAQKENVKEEEVEKIIQAQIPLTIEPEKHIEQAIAIPPTVSIEDYEEVKKMWENQYQKGEVPITENIKSRREWLEQDVVFITNTLNKLLAADEKLKQEGLNDLGYILPIFLINNLKGEELVVYLKAKLEAAKNVQEQLEKERELAEKLKEKPEELVEVKKPKKTQAEQTMEMVAEKTINQEENKDKPK